MTSLLYKIVPDFIRWASVKLMIWFDLRHSIALQFCNNICVQPSQNFQEANEKKKKKIDTDMQSDDLLLISFVSVSRFFCLHVSRTAWDCTSDRHVISS